MRVIEVDLMEVQATIFNEEVRQAAAVEIQAVAGKNSANEFLSGKYTVNHVTSYSEASQLVRMLENGPHFPTGFDFETDGWSPDMRRPGLGGEPVFVRSVSPWCPDVPLDPVIFQIYTGSGPVHVVRGEFLHLFARWLRDLAMLDGANLPFEQTVITRAGLRMPRIYRDTIHMDFLYAETTRQGRHDLKSCEEDYLGLTPPKYNFPKGFKWHYENETEYALRYASHDAWGSKFLADVLQHRLSLERSGSGYDNLWDHYQHRERPYAQSVALIDRAGMPILEQVTYQKHQEIMNGIVDVDARAYTNLGRMLNLSSNKDLARYFYVEKGYPVTNVTGGWTCLICDKSVNARTNHLCKEHGAGALVNTPKVDENTLSALEKKGDTLAPLVLERRGLEKQRGSYVEPFFSRSSPIIPDMPQYLWTHGKTKAELEGLRVMHPGLRASDIVSGRLSAPLALTIPQTGFKDQVGFPEGFGWSLVDCDFCFHGDVELDTPCGPVKISEVEVGSPIFSYDPERKVPVIGTVNQKYSRGVQATVIVELDTGAKIRCTPDHKWMVCSSSIRSGAIIDVQASELQPGMRLLPIRKAYSGPQRNYECLYSHEAIKYSKTHVEVARWKYGKSAERGVHVHHLDGNALNNHPDNLEYRDAHEHWSEHSKASATASWRDPMVREKRSHGIRASLQERGGHHGTNNPRFGDRRRRGLGECFTCRQSFEFYLSRPKRFCSFECYNESRKNGLNHKVVSVTPAPPCEVWSIGVLPHKNYALKAGVFVRNCQIELAVMAELSGDELLLEAFDCGRDMHSVTGALIEGYLAYGTRVLEDKGLRDALYQEVYDAKEALVVTDRTKDLRKRRKQGKCFHPDTEVLSRTRGWVRILDLQEGEEIAQAWPIRCGTDRVELEWTVPLEAVELIHPSGELVDIETDTVTMSLTPDHRTLVFRGTDFTVVQPEEVRNTDVIAPGGIMLGGRRLTDREAADLAVAIATQADGSYADDGSIDLRFKKDRKVARLHMLLQNSGISYRSFPKDARGYVRFRIPPAPATRVRKWLTKDKHLSWDLLNLEESARAMVLQELTYWDSNVEDGAFRYSTKHPDCAGIVQALAATLGRRSRVSADREWWRTRVSDSVRSDHVMTRMHRKTVEHTSAVACLSVPSTFVLCRYQGTTFVSGQTLNFAVIYGVGDDKLANDLGVSIASARQISGAVRAAYPGMMKYIENKIAELRAGSPVLITLGGRHRTILEVQSQLPGERAEGERLTANQSAQAGARDCIMGTMIQIAMDIEAGDTTMAGRTSYGHWVSGQGYVPDPTVLPKGWEKSLPKNLADDFGAMGRWRARVINQIHDELLLASPTEFAPRVRKRTIKLMEDPWGDDLRLRVRLRAEGKEGRTWQDAK